MVLKHAGLSTGMVHTITQNISETLENGLSLPTSKPAEPNVSYTVASSHFADIEPAFYSVDWMLYNYIGLQNQSGASHTFNISVEINSVEEYSLSNESLEDSWCYTGTVKHKDIEIGDVVDFYIWDTSGNITLDASGIAVVPISFSIAGGKRLFDLKLEEFSPVPDFTGVTGYNGYKFGMYYELWMNGLDSYHSSSTGDRSYPVWYSDGSKDWYGYYSGADGNGNRLHGVDTSLDNAIPVYYPNRMPHKISYSIILDNKGD